MRTRWTGLSLDALEIVDALLERPDIPLDDKSMDFAISKGIEDVIVIFIKRRPSSINDKPLKLALRSKRLSDELLKQRHRTCEWSKSYLFLAAEAGNLHAVKDMLD